MNNSRDQFGPQSGNGRPDGDSGREQWGIPAPDAGSGQGPGPRPKSKTGVITTAIVVVVAMAVAAGVAWWAVGSPEKRDRAGVVNAADEVFSAIYDDESLPDLNALTCERYRGDEDVILLAQREMSRDELSLAQILWGRYVELPRPRLSGEDVEFLSDRRSAAIITYSMGDEVEDEMMFRKLEGDWVLCDPEVDFSDITDDDIY